MQRRVIWLVLILALVAALALAKPLTGRDWRDLAENGINDVIAAVKTRLAPSAPSGKGAGGTATEAPPPQVTASQPVARETVDWDEYTGRFDAVEAVEIKSRVSGYLTEVHFKDGQMVKKGDLLFVIDPRPFERAVGLAAAELEQAKVKVANASLDVERGKPLVKTRVISQKTFDDRENVQRDAEAQVKVNEERLKSAQLELSFTRIMAPISGRISRTLVTEGNLVTGGTDNATTLTSIVSQDPIYFYFDVSENAAIKYKRMVQGEGKRDRLEGSMVEIALPDEKGFPHPGTLDFIDNRLDQGTGTLRARAQVPNSDGLFSAGMFGRVRVQGSAKYMALLVPDEAIGTDQASRFVWVLGSNDAPQRKAVTLGPRSDGLRVVREGLTASDWIIVKGGQRVREGQRVAAKREPISVSEAGDTVPKFP